MASRPATNIFNWADTGTIVEPSGGAKSAGYDTGDRPAAQHLNYLLRRGLADWIAYHDDGHLQAVPRPEANIPVLASSDDAHDHPSSASNKWKLVIEQFVAGQDAWARLYVGDGTSGAGGYFIITFNAVWQTASGDQNWRADDDGQASYALWSNTNGLNWFKRNAGAGTWTSAWTAGEGDVLVGGDVSVGADLTVTGNAAIPNVSGSVDIAGSLDVGADIFAADDVIAGNEFQYGAPLPTRDTIVPVTSALVEGGAFTLGGGKRLAASGANVAFMWPLRLPAGAVLGEVRVVYDQNGTNPVTVEAVQTAAFNFTTGSGGVPTALDVDAGDASIGVHVGVVDFGGLTVTAAEEYWIVLSSGQSGDEPRGIQISWTDPGPRNH